MKIYHFIFPIILVLFSSTSLGQVQPLRVGVIDFHPFVKVSERSARGPLVDYGGRLIQSAGYKPIWVPVSISRSLNLLENGQLDAVLTLFKTEERQKQADFSEKPIFRTRSGVCSVAGQIQFPPRKKLRIAHVMGTPLPESFDQHISQGVRSHQAQVRMLHLLAKGRVDIIYSPQPSLFHALNDPKASKIKLECLEFKDLERSIYMAFSKTLDKEIVTNIAQRIESALEKNPFQMNLKNLEHDTKLVESGFLRLVRP